MVTIDITTSSNIKFNAFAVDGVELADKENHTYPVTLNTIRWKCEEGRCNITGKAETDAKPKNLGLKALYLYLPMENRGIIICKNPKNSNEFGFQNHYMPVFWMKIADDEYAFVWRPDGSNPLRAK